MIITLKDTTSSEIASRIVALREEGGSATLGRVLTLIVVVSDTLDVERAIEISDAASREHPCRVIVVVDSGSTEGPARFNAQIRVGDSAGASDVVVLEPRGAAATDLASLVVPLLLPDTPVVTYWPDTPPPSPSEHPLGRLAVRRITDSRSAQCPMDAIRALGTVYASGDTDLAWSGITLWRALLATLVEDFEEIPERIRVTGHATHPSSFLIAAWLDYKLDIPTIHEVDADAQTITGVHFEFADGREVALTRRAGSQVAHLQRSGFDTAFVNLPRRAVQDCLMEELRRLDPDVFYGNILEALERIPFNSKVAPPRCRARDTEGEETGTQAGAPQ